VTGLVATTERGARETLVVADSAYASRTASANSQLVTWLPAAACENVP
jgi:hypothetical protein